MTEIRDSVDKILEGEIRLELYRRGEIDVFTRKQLRVSVSENGAATVSHYLRTVFPFRSVDSLLFLLCLVSELTL